MTVTTSKMTAAAATAMSPTGTITMRVDSA
jgi:hypothetical protein